MTEGGTAWSEFHQVNRQRSFLRRGGNMARISQARSQRAQYRVKRSKTPQPPTPQTPNRRDERRSHFIAGLSRLSGCRRPSLKQDHSLTVNGYHNGPNPHYGLHFDGRLELTSEQVDEEKRCFPLLVRSKAGNKKRTPVRDKNVPSVVASVGAQQPVFGLERRPKRGRVQVEYRVCPAYRAGPYRRLPSPTRVTRVNEDPRDPAPFLGTGDF